MANDTVLYSTSFQEGRNNKVIFIDLRERGRPPYDTFLKISERGRNARSTVHIPANKLDLLEDAIHEARELSGNKRKRSDKQASEDTIFVGNMTFDTTAEDLEELFGDTGDIVSAQIIMSGKRSSGGGLVKFTEPSAAAAAIENFHDYELKGRPLLVRYDLEPGGPKYNNQGGGGGRGGNNSNQKKGKPIPNMDNDPERTVFVAGLDWEVTQDELGEYFEQCGNVTGATIIMKGTKSAGCGLVEFSAAEEAEAAINKLSGSELHGRQIRVRFDKREEINQRLEQDGK